MSNLYPEELIEAFAHRRATVFVGAGASVAAKLPNWRQLLEPLRAEVEDCPDDNFSALDVAQYFINEHKDRRLAEVLRQLLEKNASTTEIHNLIVRLPITRIYTTNFDGLLEAACKNACLSHKTVWNSSQLDVMADRVIYKLHGDLTDPRSIVLTAEQFEDYFETHDALAKIVESEMLEHAILFVGYSFTDPDIRTILRSMRRATEEFARTHFILQIAPGKAVKAELHRRGLHVIELERGSDPTSSVVAWLRELKRRVTVEPEATAQHNLPQSTRELIGRDTDLRELSVSVVNHSLTALVGPPGIGKTSLALKFGHDSARSNEQTNFEYVVWFSAREKPETHGWLNDILNAIGLTRGYPRVTQLSLDEKRKLVDILLDKSTLIILDNYDVMNEVAVRSWLKSIPTASRVLMTAGPEFQNSPVKVNVRELKPLTRNDALHLLAQLISEMDGREALQAAAPNATEAVVDAVHGNPQAMKLLLGLTLSKPTTFLEMLSTIQSFGDKVEEVFDQLFAWSWEMLSDDAERLLLVTPLFVELLAIRGAALEESTGLSSTDFERALKQVLQFGLLESAGDDRRYVIHTKTRYFALGKSTERPKFINEARERCAKHYLDFVRSIVVRPKPDVRYWNALVTEKMKLIDPELPMIRSAVDWADTHSRTDLLIDFAMLLVHYLDSRFLNQERVLYVTKAIDALSKTDRLADESLLRIDALGWTYVEESKWQQAHEQIDEGLALTARLVGSEKDDLSALAKAWKGRALIEQNSQPGEVPNIERQRDADRLISEALGELARCSPWIRLRVNMAAGDIAFKEGRHLQALQFYEAAAASANEYGGEGGGYQIDPRIGMALISLGEIEQAEMKFKSVCNLEGIRIGNLYGDYGMALVALSRADHGSAGILVAKARDELARIGASNLLWSLLSDVYSKLQARMAASN
jgi:NAD-dependent SIR2 family protein deacetylase/tetratricopeptide (TPR) repeat protein